MSDDGKDLIKRLLTLDPKKRISSTEALEHPWMQDEEVVGKARKIMEAAARNVAMPPPPPMPVRTIMHRVCTELHIKRCIIAPHNLVHYHRIGRLYVCGWPRHIHIIVHYKMSYSGQNASVPLIMLVNVLPCVSITLSLSLSLSLSTPPLQDS